MSVLGLGDESLSVVMGRMVDHPCRATGPLISFPVRGLRPIRLQAGSCKRMMSSSFLCSFSSWMVACFFLCMLSWAILIGRVVSEGCSVIMTCGCLGGSARRVGKVEGAGEVGLGLPVCPVERICLEKEG